jgi:hypothetical protein
MNQGREFQTITPGDFRTSVDTAEQFPYRAAAEQRAVLKMVDALLEHRRAAPPAARAKRKAS